jgi:hypothetical protein
MNRKSMFALMLSLASIPAFADQFTGTIGLLEVWKNGNVAFSLSGVTTCNSQFILNLNDPGTKNQYAALLAAKTQGKAISVHTGATCIAAQGYGGSYNEPLYIYVLE